MNRKQELGWGSKVVDSLSQDLRHEFPEMKGLSPRNLVYMQTFAAAYPDYEFTQALPAQITWYHNQTILDKVSDPEQRIWYIRKTIENGWSRNVLALQIQGHHRCLDLFLLPIIKANGQLLGPFVELLNPSQLLIHKTLSFIRFGGLDPISHGKGCFTSRGYATKFNVT